MPTWRIAKFVSVSWLTRHRIRAESQQGEFAQECLQSNLGIRHRQAHMKHLDEELAGLLRVHQDAVQRLAAVPGLGVDSAQQIIAVAEREPANAPIAQSSRECCREDQGQSL